MFAFGFDVIDSCDIIKSLLSFKVDMNTVDVEKTATRQTSSFELFLPVASN
jgi:hypothetical protein